MIDSLYESYLLERQGIKCMFDDQSFVTYRIVDKECFLVDMFVKQGSRVRGRGRALLEKLEDRARDAGCDCITANIHLADRGSGNTLRASLACGFEVLRAQNDVLLISKRVGED